MLLDGMKNIKGFIQIPLLIAIIAGVLVVGGGGYLGVKQYKNLQSDKQELTRGGEKAKEGNENIKSAELETLRKEIDELKSQPPQFIVKERISVQERIIEKPSGTITVDYNSISAQEIDPYLTGIVRVICGATSGQCEYEGKKVSCLQPKSSGTGSLWNLPSIEGYMVLTNNHVVNDPKRCSLDIYDESLNSGSVSNPHILKMEKIIFNAYTDIGLFKIHQDEFPIPTIKNAYAPTDLNYKIGTLHQCNSKMPIGSPTVVVGFPAFGVKEDTYNYGSSGTWSLRHNRIVTDGIVSGHDKSVGPLPYPNYFVSAKIDSGNSGGIAFSKDEQGLCILGVPTWLTIGNFETQGLVQNIHNIFYRN